MALGLYSPTPRESRISSTLRRKAVAEIRRRRNLEAVAELLALETSGVEALLWEPKWSLEVAFRVADALGIEVADHMEQAVVGL